ncbi:MAG: RluA family pseudouridine synthase [Caldilineae bacterium]|nr:MAG: RluA family pseudouridine synthase [Caldilineae bacterium]
MLELTAINGGERLDRFLSNHLPDHSRAEIQRWIKEGDVLVNGKMCRSSYRLHPGDRISIDVPIPAPSPLEPEAIPLTILYEDADMLAVDKPAGMVVHPAPGHERGTLVHAVLHHCPDLQGVGGVRRPGIVHRLDKDTSGLILVAKHDRAHRYLQAQFKARTVEKTYLALVLGHIEAPKGRIEAPLGRHPRHRKKMAVTSSEKGRQAITEFEILGYYGPTTFIAAHPLTGRTHQIRVHMASIGHPLVGDTVYGPRRDSYRLGRHFLHAHRLCVDRPADGARLELVSPLPPDLEALLHQLAPVPQ